MRLKQALVFSSVLLLSSLSACWQHPPPQADPLSQDLTDGMKTLTEEERSFQQSEEESLALNSQLNLLDTSELVSLPPQTPEFSDVDEPDYRLSENSNNFAVIVGIEDYQQLPAAQFAAHDAQAVRKHLIALGYPEGNIKYLTGPRAVKSAIESYVEEWLPRNTNKDSEVFFYFSGHGAPDPETRTAYLMPWDGNLEFLDKTGYPIKDLYNSLNALKAKHVFIVLDSCFSGTGGRSVVAAGARPLINQLDMGQIQSDTLISLSAAAQDQIAGTLPGQSHGLFTYYFLNGLNGKARDKHGHITVESLFDYLSPQVQAQANKENRDQTPQLLSSNAEESLELR